MADENLNAIVVRFLRDNGFDVCTAVEEGLCGAPDLSLLRRAVPEGRLIVTHDADFGTLAVRAGEPVVGIVYLRPGHIDPTFTVDTLRALFTQDPDVEPPFLLVARRTGDTVTVRIRPL